MLAFTCPHCRTRLSAPDAHEGRQITCQVCGQLVQLPGKAPAQTVPEQEKRSPSPEPDERPSRRNGERRSSRRHDEDERDEDRPSRRRHEDDRDEDRPSRRRYEDRDDREDRPRRGRREECPECGSRRRPRVEAQMATISIVLICIGIFFWPLILVGIFLRERWEVCDDCGHKLRQVSGPEFSA